MTKHLVVLSDLHLWQATDHDSLWMRYRHRRFLPDAQIAELLALLCQQIPDGDLELVLNGDIFDFDIPPVVDGHAVPMPTPRTEPAAVERLQLILDDHALFLRALAVLLIRRHRVVFVPGNHDLQLTFPLARSLLAQRILLACQELEPTWSAESLAEQLAIHPWFYQTRHGVHIEHGNQYDPLCSVADPVWPLRIDGSLQTNVGALALEHLIGKLGYFNPNVESSFLLTTREYFDHWVRYYMRTPRSLVGTFVMGALRVIGELIAAYGLLGPTQRAVELQSAEEAAHTTLFALTDLRAAMRVLYVDRVLMLAATALTALLFWLWAPLGVLGLLATVALHRSLRPRGASDLTAIAAGVARSARLLARIYGARAVLFGHTHQAAGQWEADVFYGNSGTWVPQYHDVACSIPIEESRPFIWLREEGSQLEGGLYRFHDGKLHLASEPRPQHPPPAGQTQPAAPQSQPQPQPDPHSHSASPEKSSPKSRLYVRPAFMYDETGTLRESR